jgi:hypothetical protein
MVEGSPVIRRRVGMETAVVRAGGSTGLRRGNLSTFFSTSGVVSGRALSAIFLCVGTRQYRCMHGLFTRDIFLILSRIHGVVWILIYSTAWQLAVC